MVPNMTKGQPEGQMASMRFVLIMLGTALGFMVARWLIPHFIDGVAVYTAVALCALAMLGAVVGVIRG